MQSFYCYFNKWLCSHHNKRKGFTMFKFMSEYVTFPLIIHFLIINKCIEKLSINSGLFNVLNWFNIFINIFSILHLKFRFFTHKKITLVITNHIINKFKMTKLYENWAAFIRGYWWLFNSSILQTAVRY